MTSKLMLKKIYTTKINANFGFCVNLRLGVSSTFSLTGHLGSDIIIIIIIMMIIIIIIIIITVLITHFAKPQCVYKYT